MTMPLHLAMLTSDAFPVRLLGLVHVGNKIISRRPIAEDEALDVHCSLPAHRETDRGQEFDLTTTASVQGSEIWSETSTFLARRRAKAQWRKGRGQSTERRNARGRAEHQLASGRRHRPALRSGIRGLTT